MNILVYIKLVNIKIYKIKKLWKEFLLYINILTKPQSWSTTLGCPIFTSYTDSQLVSFLLDETFWAQLVPVALEFSKNAAAWPVWILVPSVCSNLFWSLEFQRSRVAGIAVSWALIIGSVASPHCLLLSKMWSSDPTCFWICFSLPIRIENYGD